jgi:hypothetical protein
VIVEVVGAVPSVEPELRVILDGCFGSVITGEAATESQNMMIICERAGLLKRC